MNLSKSKYCNGVQCKKILWLDKNLPKEKEDLANESILDNGKDVGELAKNLFGFHIDINFNNDLNVMIEDTKTALTNENVIVTEASFNYDNNFCSIDILKKDSNSYEIYEVKSSTEIKDIYYDDIAYQYYIMNSLGYNIIKTHIVYLNNNYVRYGDLELDKLFVIEDVTDKTINKQEEVISKIKEMKEYLSIEAEPPLEVGMQCVTPYECPYFKHCTKHLPEQNIFKIRRMRNSSKFSLYNRGIYTYQDLLKEDIDWKFKQQIEFELYNRKPVINEEKIREFIKELSYPLYFLDFETYQEPIPKYDGIKPYMQIPFQYSLHYIEKEDAPLEHTDFLAEPNIDPRRVLAEKLVKDIPLNVCTVAYNMMFEKMVIKNLASLYPELREHLMNIHDNMKDLMIPFKNRHYYTKEMQGSYSIKYVLPALFPDDESLDYHNLDLIHNGSEAMSAYASHGKLPKEEQQIIRDNLLKYCKLDTYAMVKIWEKLKDI